MVYIQLRFLKNKSRMCPRLKYKLISYKQLSLSIRVQNIETFVLHVYKNLSLTLPCCCREHSPTDADLFKI